MNLTDPTGKTSLLAAAAMFYGAMEAAQRMQSVIYKKNELEDLIKLKNVQMSACLNFPQGGACQSLPNVDKQINTCARQSIAPASNFAYGWLPSVQDKALDILKEKAK